MAHRWLDFSEVEMKRILLSFFIASMFSLTSNIAKADLLSLWVRGDGIYLQGDPELAYFSDNTLGPGYGFGAGLEIVFVDLLFDANFFPDGAQFNQLGIGLDIDLIPLSAIHISPTAQLFYAFGKFDDDRESIKALHPRAGAQVGVNFAKYLWLNAEGYAGYLLTTPDVGAGLIFSGGVNLTVKLDILNLFLPGEDSEASLEHQPHPAHKQAHLSPLR